MHKRVIRNCQLGSEIYWKVIHFHCESNRWTLFWILHLAKNLTNLHRFCFSSGWHASVSSGNRTIQSFMFLQKVILNCTKTMEINIPACINRNNNNLIQFNILNICYMIFQRMIRISLRIVFYFRQHDLINGGWGLYGADRATYGSSNGSSNGRITPEQYWIAVNTRVENIRWKGWSLLVCIYASYPTHLYLLHFKYNVYDFFFQSNRILGII